MTRSGGAEIQARPESSDRDEHVLELTKEQQAGLRAYIEERELTRSQVQQLVQQLQIAMRDNLYWEFKFLTLFLVPRTKLTLEWVIRSGQVPITAIHRYLLTDLQTVEEKEWDAVVDALLSYGLIRMQGQTVMGTEKGFQFLQFIGLIPSHPN